MRTHYSDITEDEKKVLQDQYEASPFHLNNKQTLKPTQLDIFDFDSTLFLSPSLSPTLWHPSLIKQLVGEDVFGPGWWKDYRSLDLGPIDKLEKTQWANYWNEDIVAEARRSLADPTIMTVVLTGRRHIPFYPLISRMLKSKQLDFDLIGLRPDPTQESHDAHVKHGSSKRFNNYGASSVFVNTLDFKTCFILNLLHNIPSLNTVHMWDDRINHVKKFNDFLQKLASVDLLTGSHVQHVPAVLPRYRPQWEQKVVAHVLETHNANELLYRKNQAWDRNVRHVPWDSDEKSSCVIKVAKHLSLQPIPSTTVVILDPTTVDALRTLFEQHYTTPQATTGWRAHAEQPQWFGKHIILAPHTLSPHLLQRLHGLRLGSKVNIIIRKLSKPDPESGSVMALVNIYNIGTTQDDTRKRYLLPLMYKPSQANAVLKKKFEWTTNHHHVGQGHVGFAELLGLDGKVKGGEAHQLVCLDWETRDSVLGKRATDPIGVPDKKQHLLTNESVE